jgi:hypothetical protein
VDGPDFLSMDYIPPNHGGAALVWVIDVGFFGVVLAGIIAFIFWRARELRTWEARDRSLLTERTKMPLLPGRGRVVHGRVDPDDGGGAFNVEIVQVVKNHTSKNSKWHVWEEISRRVNVTQFYLVRDDGIIVYVEPNERALLVDSLTTEYPPKMPMYRIRRAQLRVGEELHAYGNLFDAPHPRAREHSGGGAYRGAATGLVMRAPQGAPMLLASEALSDRYAARIRFLRTTAIVLAIGWTAFHALFTAPFLITSFFATRTTTALVGTTSFVTRNKNNSTTHYVLETKTSDGFTLDDEVDLETWEAARAVHAGGEAASIPIMRVGDSKSLSELGTEPYGSTPAMICAFVFFAIAFLVVGLSYGTKLAWYDRKKLNEHGGSGHWVESRS